MTETTINNVISDIIAARQSKVEALRVKRKELTVIRENLEKLLQKSESVKQDDNFQKLWTHNPWLKELMEDPEKIKDCAAHYAAAIRELDRLIGRYKRDSVNIAVVGDTRAGKSRLLQTISGLDNDCIPSYKGSFCTGVSSVIQNDCTLQPGQVQAVITFKTEEEILEEINAKLKNITGGGLHFNTLTALRGQSPEQLKSQMTNTAVEGEEGHISDFIKMYAENINEWYEFIQPTGSGEDARTEVFTDKKDIRTYVAKHNGGDQENGGVGATLFYRYIAVKNAVIYCRFRLTDVNQLRLVDTVGLGDPEDGNTVEKMYAAIDTESDAALFLFRPSANEGGMIKDWTYDILNMQLCRRYRNADMEKWMGVVINFDGKNWNECMAFQEKFKENAPVMAKNVVFDKIINVSEWEEVREEGLMPILESLSQNLSSIDARIERGAVSLIDAANKVLVSLKEGCQEVRVPTQEDLVFDNRKKIFSKFADTVRALSSEERGLEDDFLKKSLEMAEALKEKRTTEICRMFDYASAPSSRQYLAFGELQREVRQIGSRDDQNLDNAEATFKQQLAAAFLDSFEFEKARCPAPESGTFFREMADQLFGVNAELKMLKDAFLSIHAFKLNETKGITKILFNENADKHLTCENADRENTAAAKEDKVQNPPRPTRYPTPSQSAVSVTQRFSSGTPAWGASAADHTGGEKPAGDSENDPLVQKLNRQLGLFADGIRQSPFYAMADLIPISSQIAAELQHFLHFFDVCYQVEWTNVLNQQLRDGYIFASKKQDIDHLSEKFEQLRRLANQAVVNVRIPQNISDGPV